MEEKCVFRYLLVISCELNYGMQENIDNLTQEPQIKNIKELSFTPLSFYLRSRG
jgi:hypothetical protein